MSWVSQICPTIKWQNSVHIVVECLPKKKGTYNLLSLAVHSTIRVKVKAWTIFTNMGQVHMPN